MAVFLAWDLSLRDLKQISINGITHSSCDKETISSILANVFNKKWEAFIDYVLENYEEELF
jgi:hypothetical protein